MRVSFHNLISSSLHFERGSALKVIKEDGFGKVVKNMWLGFLQSPLFLGIVHSPNHLIQQIHTHDLSGMALGLVQFVASDPRVIKAWGPLLNMRLKLD